MPVPDYSDAAERHWHDACLLEQNNCVPNADQLFGLAAECALKAIMLPLGMKMKNNKPEDKKHGHIHVLWDEFHSFANSRSAAKYANMLDINNPFIDWRVDQRYETGSQILHSALAIHKAGAQQSRSSFIQARNDGVV